MDSTARIDRIQRHLSGLAPAACAAPASDEGYDFVVVGGGSAGVAMAARLSENPSVRVLLLEAGEESDTLAVRIPLGYAKLQCADTDWQFRTTPQTADRVSFWPRGKALGGSSSINAMLWVRGARQNFDDWAAAGCTGWDYEGVLPYFKRMEDCRVGTAEPEYHGQGGPMTVTGCETGNFSPMADRFVQAGAEAGLPRNQDYNGRTMHGVSFGQHNITPDTKIRCSTAEGYLRRGGAGARPNLTVLCKAHVTRVVMQGNTCIGVLYRHGSTDVDELRAQPDVFVRARREVVVCGGAVNTPWLLQASGIGPRALLERLDVPVVADLPVGENLLDHMIVFHIFKMADTATWWPIPPHVTPGRLWAIAKYFLFKSGPLACTALQGNVFTATGLRGDSREGEEEPPDLQIHFIPAVPGPELMAQANLQHLKPYSEDLPAYGALFLPTLLLPKSVGYVHIQSNDPLDYPEVNPRYLSDPEGYDMQVLVEGMKLARRIAKGRAFEGELAEEVVDSTIPHPPESDEYLREYIRRAASTVYHPTTTAKMGAAHDTSAVVDPRLKVRGLQGLRVADASVMPSLVSGNTNAAAIMIGDKGADIILQDHGLA